MVATSMEKQITTGQKVGRPSSYTLELGQDICNRIATGESLRTICDEDGYPSRPTVLAWLANPERAEFLSHYIRAREAQADWHAEKIIEIADTPLMGVKTKTNDKGEVETTEGDMIEHRRLQVDARKWYASKLAPKKYGDKQEITGKDGAPLMPVAEVSDNDIARRLAFLLTKGIKG